MSALSPPPGGLPSPGLPPDHVGLGCLGMAPSPPTMHHLGEGRGLGTQAGSPSPPSGCWPFKAAGCQGLSPGDPEGRAWSGTRSPFSCHLRAAHRPAWGGRRGADRQRQGGQGWAEQRSGQGERQRHRDTEREAAGHAEACGPPAPTRLQPPKLLLDPAEPGVARQHQRPLGPKWGSWDILGRPLTHP